MIPSYDQLTILRIAKSYYLDNLSQQEISEKEKIHRTQISRILKLARERGYVQINVSVPESHDADSIGKQLEIALGLRQVVIAPTILQQGNPLEAFYFCAARYLEKTLPYCKNVGIGLGKTLYNIASQLTLQATTIPPNFFSVAGSSGTENSYLQAGVLLDMFARKFNGRCHYNNFYIYLRRSMASQSDLMKYEELQRAYQTLDTVVLSVGGAFEHANPYYEEYSLVANENAQAFFRPHGDLLGHVFYDNYECYTLPDEYLITSMSPAMLAKVPNVICIAQGAKKISTIISAARQKYIKVLITDEATGRELLWACTGTDNLEI